MRRLISLLVALSTLVMALHGCVATIAPIPGEVDLRRTVTEAGFWQEVRAVAELTDDDEPAPAVCWLSDGRAQIRESGGGDRFTTTEMHRMKIVVLDAKRAERYANIRVPCSSSRPVRNIEARTILKDGTAIYLDPRDIHERSRFPDYMLYADQREKVFAMPAIEDSCIIEYQYVRTSGGMHFEDHFVFDMFIPVRKASYSFAMPVDVVEYGVKVTTRSYGDVGRPLGGTQHTVEGDLAKFTWTMEGIRALAREPYMPPIRAVASRAAVGLQYIPRRGEHTWETLGDDYFQSTIGELLETDALLSRTAEEWSQGATSARERIELIGSAVAEHIRYVAVALEDSGWEPQAPSATLKAKYGDCKDVSVLTVALLRAAGVEAAPALVMTRSEGSIDATVVTPSLMNHMIVMAKSEDGDCWLDPTASAFALGELPSDNRGVRALVLADNGSCFHAVPKISPDDNRVDTHVRATLDEEGNLTGELRSEYHGDLALQMRGFLDSVSGDEAKKAVERWMEDTYSHVRVTGWGCETEGSPRPCILTVDFESEGCAQLSSGRMILDGNVFGTGRREGTLPDRERRYDVVFDGVYSTSETVALELPGGWHLDGLPDDVHIQSEFGSFTRQFDESDNVLHSSRSFRLTSARIHSGKYGELRAFTVSVERAESEPLLLVRS